MPIISAGELDRRISHFWSNVRSGQALTALALRCTTEAAATRHGCFIQSAHQRARVNSIPHTLHTISALTERGLRGIHAARHVGHV
jgi:hypothetical protein